MCLLLGEGWLFLCVVCSRRVMNEMLRSARPVLTMRPPDSPALCVGHQTGERGGSLVVPRWGS